IDDISKPIPVRDALSDQAKDYDCLPCRLMGSAAFTGLGIYSYASGMSQLQKQKHEILKAKSRFGMGARKGGIFGISAILVAMGVYRLTN
ncbi:uncharacterized protein K489DRAFT_301066, partial [Dissoconium aciculare CBS 342.82]|uniref:Distal membrane-arm assembly complex protein 1-like domain-containing protein n=1 Tax=Dissoconium aciculare CBS 342.82 TaxID=1314786 RepID=A0A6J3MBS0_9PEZI